MVSLLGRPSLKLLLSHREGKVLSSVAAKPGRGGKSGKGMCWGGKSAWAETPAELWHVPRLQEGPG